MIEPNTHQIGSIEQRLVDHNIKGFLPEGEAVALYRMALNQVTNGAILEIGSFCGKSAVYLGEAAKYSNQPVFTVDHHRGSEEHQQGEAYFDADHWDEAQGCVDTLPSLRRTLALFQLEDVVIPVVARSERLAQFWQLPLAMVFVDGGHSAWQAKEDCLRWVKHLMPGGILAIHDIFEHPEDGGQAPFEAMKTVKTAFNLKQVDRVGSLVFLKVPD